MSIISKLEKPGLPESLNLNNFDSIFLEVLQEVSAEIKTAVRHIVFCQNSSVDVPSQTKAYTEEIKLSLRKYLINYLFVNKKWKTNQPLYLYLKSMINIIAATIISESGAGINYQLKPVCPICRASGLKEPLLKVKRNELTCYTCSHILNNYDDGISTLSESKLRLIKCFSNHSCRGVECNKCKNFVPASNKINNRIICPYDLNDCTDCKIKAHPLANFIKSSISIDDELSTSNGGYISGMTIVDNELYKEKEVVEDDVESQEFIQYKLNILKQIIENQKNRLPIKKTPNKKLMYSAINNILNKYPKESVGYFMNGKFFKENPIQPIIYQEFAELMKQSLPLKIKNNNQEIIIDNVLDKNLQLFNGINKCSGFVNSNLIFKVRPEYKSINNNFIDNEEKAFIGSLIEVTDGNTNLNEHVEFCSFKYIKFKSSFLPYKDKNITITYYSIYPHYTMCSMAILQRIRKKIFVSSQKKELVL